METETSKKELVFACRWDKDFEKSWSGSAYAIYKEFLSRYDVKRFDISDSFKVRRFKLLRKLKLVHGEPSMISTIRKTSRRFKNKYGDSSKLVFQFMEAPITENTRNYIYQDLNLEYLVYLHEEDKEAFKYCGFSNISGSELERRRIIQNEYYAKCKGVFTMGKWLADFMVDRGIIDADRVHVVGAGINVQTESPDYSRRNGHRILFVGKDFKRKGGELVVRAFEILKRKYMPEAELYIIGPKEYPLDREYAGVTFLGNMQKEQVAEYFQLCDIFCMPSYFEAFGIAFCEALAYGMPCIARNKYAMREIIEDGKDGLLIDDDNEETLACRMRDLLKNESIRAGVKARREEYLKKYSWSEIADKMEQIMNSEK